MATTRGNSGRNMIYYPSIYLENDDEMDESNRPNNLDHLEALNSSEVLMPTRPSAAYQMNMSFSNESLPTRLVPIHKDPMSLSPVYTTPSRPTTMTSAHSSQLKLLNLPPSETNNISRDEGCLKTFLCLRANKWAYIITLIILILSFLTVGLGIYFLNDWSATSINDGSTYIANNNDSPNDEVTKESTKDTEPLYPPVPGIRLAGLTIDALYGVNTDRRAINMDNFSEGKAFRDSSNSKTYSVPNSVQNVHRETSCSSDISVNEYKNTEEYTKSYSVGLDVGYGAFSLSSETTWSTSSMTESNGRLYEAKLSCVIYKAALNTQTIELTTEFTKTIENVLPDNENDWESYLAFFKIWGTHFYDTVELGGIMQSNIVYSEDYISKKKSFDMTIAAKASLDVSVGASFGMKDEEIKESRENQEATKQFHKGGNPEVFFKSGFETWVGTIDNNPDVIHFNLSPLSDWVKKINLKKGIALETAVKKYLNYIGNYNNPAENCLEIQNTAKYNNYRIFDQGIFYIKGQSDVQVIPALCNFDIRNGGWTLVVNKLGDWQGSFMPSNAWHRNTGINSIRPTLVADYKLQFMNTVESDGITQFMMQENINAGKGARISGTFDPHSKWEEGPVLKGGNYGMRRKLVQFRDVNLVEPLYLVLSEDGGMCVINPSHGSGFNCNGKMGQSKGEGLFDSSSKNEFANCDTYNWKDSAGGGEPISYYSRCGAIGTDTSQDCGRGHVIYSNCCGTHLNDGSSSCGFLGLGCKCDCQRSRSHTTYCNEKVGYVSLWVR